MITKLPTDVTKGLKSTLVIVNLILKQNDGLKILSQLKKDDMVGVTLNEYYASNFDSDINKLLESVREKL